MFCLLCHPLLVSYKHLDCSALSLDLSFSPNDDFSTNYYHLSLHDALPISEVRPRQEAARRRRAGPALSRQAVREARRAPFAVVQDRKSTRLNSSHGSISYAVFCLIKKIKYETHFLLSA